jgi:hypothetical protein
VATARSSSDRDPILPPPNPVSPATLRVPVVPKPLHPPILLRVDDTRSTRSGLRWRLRGRLVQPSLPRAGSPRRTASQPPSPKSEVDLSCASYLREYRPLTTNSTGHWQCPHTRTCWSTPCRCAIRLHPTGRSTPCALGVTIRSSFIAIRRAGHVCSLNACVRDSLPSPSRRTPKRQTVS